MSDAMSDEELSEIRDALDECGCRGEMCDGWGCGTVRRLVAALEAERKKVATLRAAMERVNDIDSSFNTNSVAARVARDALEAAA